MKIVYVTDHFPPLLDGVVVRLIQTLRHLASYDVKVYVITNEYPRETHVQATIYPIKGIRLFFNKKRKVMLPSRRLPKLLEAIRPDIIHAINPLIVGHMAIKYAKKQQIPVISSQHTDYPKYLSYYSLSYLNRMVWSFLRRTLNNSDVTLCTSNIMKKRLSENRIQNAKLWPVGIDTTLFHPNRRSSQMRNRLTDAHPDMHLFIYVGRLAPEKNIDLLHSFIKHKKNSYLAIVGDGPSKRKLTQLFQYTQTVFTGSLIGEELAKVYASADALILPSSTETLGFVILEAMASGTPVIAANAGGPRDLIQHNKDGFLFTPDDPASLTHYATELIHSPKNTQDMALRARKKVSQYSWAAATKQLMTVYNDVLNQRR